MKTLNYNNIMQEILVCPYCMNPVSDMLVGCCGESSGHFEVCYITHKDEWYLASEVRFDSKETEEIKNV